MERKGKLGQETFHCDDVEVRYQHCGNDEVLLQVLNQTLPVLCNRKGWISKKHTEPGAEGLNTRLAEQKYWVACPDDLSVAINTRVPNMAKPVSPYTNNHIALLPLDGRLANSRLC